MRTIFEHFHLSFHVPVASISEMNQRMHAMGNGGTGPATADSRYVTEDLPYGLALTCVPGDLAGRPAHLHAAGVRIFSAMYGRDFGVENELLGARNLGRYTQGQPHGGGSAGAGDATITVYCNPDRAATLGDGRVWVGFEPRHLTVLRD